MTPMTRRPDVSGTPTTAPNTDVGRSRPGPDHAS